MHVKGKRVAMLSTGRAVIWAEEVRDILEEVYKIKPSLIEIPAIVPLDKQNLANILNGYSIIVTIEDHILSAGFGTLIENALIMCGISKKYMHFGYESGIIEHGKVEDILNKYNLLPYQIAKRISNALTTKSNP
ncbi:MAG: hypothetical protein BEN19_03745 [Epulopiscium sp. Nuni2H_MBin003]|nr:MAG: hypothetical protein BEN19_03745 [Epulopiscium sp. Nuni2H_MBin003]